MYRSTDGSLAGNGDSERRDRLSLVYTEPATLVSRAFARVHGRAYTLTSRLSRVRADERRREERMRERIRATRSLVNVPCRTVSYRIYPSVSVDGEDAAVPS